MASVYYKAMTGKSDLFQKDNNKSWHTPLAFGRVYQVSSIFLDYFKNIAADCGNVAVKNIVSPDRAAKIPVWTEPKLKMEV